MPTATTPTESVSVHGVDLRQLEKPALKIYLVSLAKANPHTGVFAVSKARFRALSGLTLASVDRGVWDLERHHVIQRIADPYGSRPTTFRFRHWLQRSSEAGGTP